MKSPDRRRRREIFDDKTSLHGIPNFFANFFELENRRSESMLACFTGYDCCISVGNYKYIIYYYIIKEL